MFEALAIQVGLHLANLAGTAIVGWLAHRNHKQVKELKAQVKTADDRATIARGDLPIKEA